MANTTIHIKSPKGVLLKTKDKYCENDITVIPELEETPEYNEVEDFAVFVGGTHEGEVELGYSVSQKVALPAASSAYLASIEDENFLPSNIKKDVYIFGLKGEYEGESGGGDEFSADKYFAEGYKEINLPNATKIRSYAFHYNTVLEKISVPKVTSIGSYAFSWCSKLASIELPSGLTSIGDEAFNSCSKLASIELPSGLTNIGSRTFSWCSKLASIELPSGLRSMGLNAFQNCSTLKCVIFKGKPNSIPSSAFSSCTNLTVIYVPWGEGEVSGSPWSATKATIIYNSTPMTFTVDTTQWTALKGITWEDFISSSYNTDDTFYVSNNAVWNKNNGFRVARGSEADPVALTDVIEENYTYWNGNH